MTEIPFLPPGPSANSSWAGGEASGTDIFGASAAEAATVSNTNAAYTALEEAYDRRIRAIKAATGEELSNPLSDAELVTEAGAALGPIGGALFGPVAAALQQRRFQAQVAFEDRLRALAEAHPDPESRDAIGAGRPLAADAEAIARQNDGRLAALMQAHPGWDKYLWGFAGGAAGSLRDPVQIGSLALGGGLGGGRTIAGQILREALTQGLVAGVTTAATEPTVQQWRARAGLDAGFDQAVSDVALGAATGGVLGGGLKGLGVAARELARARPGVAPEVKAGLEGDGAAAAAALDPIRDALPAEVRGAMDAATAPAPVPEPEPGVVRQQRADLLESRAAQAAQSRELPPLSLPDDEAQIARVADMLAPAPETLAGYTPANPSAAELDRLAAEIVRGPETADGGRPLTGFVKSLGGIDPKSPLADELRARGITAQSAPGLYRRGGRAALDNIPRDELPDDVRQAIADDGNGYGREQDFIDRLEAEQGAPAASGGEELRAAYERRGVDFSAPPEEIRARLAAIAEADARFAARDAEIASNLPQETEGSPAGQSSRQRAEAAVRLVQRELRGNFPDELVHAAADLVLNEHESVHDAIDFVLLSRGMAAAANERLAASITIEQGQNSFGGPDYLRLGGKEEVPVMVVRPRGIEPNWEDEHAGGTSGLGFYETPDAVHVLYSGLPPRLRGRGIGIAMYERLAAYATAEGKPLLSDDNVSADAARMYEALAARGYEVTRSADAIPGSEAGYSLAKWVSPSGPVYRVTAGRAELSLPGPFDALGPEPPPLTEADIAALPTADEADFDLARLNHLLEDFPQGERLPFDGGEFSPQELREALEAADAAANIVAHCSV